MQNVTEIDQASVIMNRWDRVFHLEENAHRGDEDALRHREQTGARRWLLFSHGRAA